MMDEPENGKENNNNSNNNNYKNTNNKNNLAQTNLSAFSSRPVLLEFQILSTKRIDQVDVSKLGKKKQKNKLIINKRTTNQLNKQTNK
jgi:hypothetical protein